MTESKFLTDSVLGITREVDIAIEGEVDGDPIVISVEIIERSRRASVNWVQQMIRKHLYLSTNLLLLASKSGFSQPATIAVEREGGHVQALTPEVIQVNGEAVVKNLYVDPQSRPPSYPTPPRTAGIHLVPATGSRARIVMSGFSETAAP